MSESAASGDEVIEVTVQVERTYNVNLSKIRRDFAKELAADLERRSNEYAVMQETFLELCGFDRDQDHVDGSYVWLKDERVDYDLWLTLQDAVPA